MTPTRVAGTLLALVVAAGDAHAAVGLRHVPPAEAQPGVALTLEASVAQGWDSTLEVRYRTAGTLSWSSATFRRQGQTRYAVDIPASRVVPPGLEYFIVRTRERATSNSFASAEAPHRVNVYERPDNLWRDRELGYYHGRRARVRAATEFVDFGSRTLGTTKVDDRYLRLDLDFSYRILRAPLHSLRFGYTRLLGETPVSARGDDGSCPAGTPRDDCALSAGFRVGGWFELRFQSRSGAAFDARGMVMATPEGFRIGGRGELRLGREFGSHIAAGAEHVADTGSTGFVRLGWGTVPDMPMAATIEVTTLPSSHRALAVRLVYDVARRFEGGLLIGARVGYQARDQIIGGVSAGLNMAWDF